MATRTLVTSTLLLVGALYGAGAFGDAGHKTVLNTPWWPPGTEKKEESVGILARGLVYMTGMMEANHTLAATVAAELSDVQDIAAAANSTTQQLLACLANAAPGTREQVRHSFATGLPGVPLTVAEMPGEWSFFNTSVSCVGTVDIPRRASSGSCSGSLAGEVLSLSCEAETIEPAVQEAAALVRELGGRGARDLAECTVLVRSIAQAGAVREEFGSLPAVLTIVQAGVSGASMQCTGAVGKHRPEHAVQRVTGAGLVPAVIANGFVYVAGIPGKLRNGTDSLAVLQRTLEAAGADMASVVNCVFFVKRLGSMVDLFGGFYDVFNKQFPPPPSRTEFVADSECAECQVLTKCIAVL